MARSHSFPAGTTYSQLDVISEKSQECSDYSLSLSLQSVCNDDTGSEETDSSTGLVKSKAHDDVSTSSASLHTVICDGFTHTLELGSKSHSPSISTNANRRVGGSSQTYPIDVSPSSFVRSFPQGRRSRGQFITGSSLRKRSPGVLFPARSVLVLRWFRSVIVLVTLALLLATIGTAHSPSSTVFSVEWLSVAAVLMLSVSFFVADKLHSIPQTLLLVCAELLCLALATVACYAGIVRSLRCHLDHRPSYDFLSLMRYLEVKFYMNRHEHICAVWHSTLGLEAFLLLLNLIHCLCIPMTLQSRRE